MAHLTGSWRTWLLLVLLLTMHTLKQRQPTNCAHPVGTSAGVTIFYAVLSAWSSWSGAYSQHSIGTTACLPAIVLACDQLDLFSEQSWMQQVLFEHGCSSSAFCMLMHDIISILVGMGKWSIWPTPYHLVAMVSSTFMLRKTVGESPSC